jgi:hypothetical protein
MTNWFQKKKKKKKKKTSWQIGINRVVPLDVPFEPKYLQVYCRYWWGQ